MSQHVNNEQKTIVIAGGGLVGALNACYMAQRGYTVHMYERREDIRAQEFVRGRSINLALSCRGREALRGVGLEEYVTSAGIPMYGRMIHDRNGCKREIPYGRSDQYIMSVDRRKLNELMLTAAEKHPNVTIHFEHKFVNYDLEKNVVHFKSANDNTVSAAMDVLLACDGAYSAVRNQLQRSTRLDFSQEYIPHGYMELAMPPLSGNQFCMEKNFLHIWPRNQYMLIALPNTEDSSFVLTLFMPFKQFEAITNKTEVLAFFQENFPDAVPLIGKENLIQTFLSSKPLPMVSIKCGPYHVDDKLVLMGDAAHAMVPFYGQGMNCGFEDCLELNALLSAHNGNWGRVLEEYTKLRRPDCHAMCDLAMYNYIEMRASVNSKLFLWRKRFDNFLFWLMPSTWVPLYTMVAFTRTRYSECVSRRKWQDVVVARLFTASATSLALFTTFTVCAIAFTTNSNKSVTHLFEEMSAHFWDKLGY